MRKIQIDSFNYKFEISSHEFILLWSGRLISDPSYREFYIEESIENWEDLNIITTGDKTIKLKLENVEIRGYVSLSENENYLPIIMKNVLFHDTLSISKGLFKGINFISVESKERISIGGGSFKNYFSVGIRNTEINFGGKANFEVVVNLFGDRITLNVHGGQFIKGLRISGVYENAFVDGGIFHRDIILDNITCEKSFQIVSGQYYKYINRLGEWDREEFFKEVNFIESGIMKIGIFRILGNLVFSNISPDYIKLDRDVLFDNKFSFIENLYLIDMKNSIFIQGSDRNPFVINQVYIEDCLFVSTDFFKIQQINLSLLSFRNIISRGNIHVGKIKGDRFYRLTKTEKYLHDDYDFNGINVTEELKKSVLELIETDLGNSVIFYSDFSNFDIIFDSSKIDNLFVSGCFFPREIKTINPKNHNQKRIAYNQFNKVIQKNDLIESYNYGLLELEEFRQDLKEKKIKSGDRIILFLNHFTSLHNTDWFRAFIIIMVFTTISYTFYLYFLGFNHINFSKEGVSNFLKFSSFFFTYLNPLHKPDFLKPTFSSISWNPCVELIDSVTRIINSFLIYQFIQAFRKFGRYK